MSQSPLSRFLFYVFLFPAIFAQSLAAQSSIANIHEFIYNTVKEQRYGGKIPRVNTPKINRIMFKPENEGCFAISAAMYTDESFENQRRYFNIALAGTSRPDSIFKKINAENFVASDPQMKFVFLKNRGLFEVSTTELRSDKAITDYDTVLVHYNDGVYSGQFSADMIVLEKNMTVTSYCYEVTENYGYTFKRHAYSRSYPETNKAWTHKELVSFPSQKHFATVACNNDSMQVQCYNQISIKTAFESRWHGEYVTMGNPITLRGESFKAVVAISRDNKFLYYINGQNKLVKLNLENGVREKTSTAEFKDVIRGKGIRKKPLVFMEGAGYCCLYDTEKDSVYYTIKGIDAADISNNGQSLASTSNGRIMLFDGLTGKYLREHTFTGANTLSKYKKNEFEDLSFSWFDSKGNWCAYGDEHVKVFNKTDRFETRCIPFPQEKMSSVGLRNNGRILAGENYSEDSLVVFFPEAPTKTRIYAIEKFCTYNFSSAGNYLMIRKKENDTIAVHNLNPPYDVRYAVIPGIKTYFTARCWMHEPSGKIAVRGYNNMFGYDLNNKTEFQISTTSFDLPTLIMIIHPALSENSYCAEPVSLGRYLVFNNPLVSGKTEMGSIMFWNKADSTQQIFKCHKSSLYSWVFSSDGKLLLTNGDEGKTRVQSTSKLWKVNTSATGAISLTLLDSLTEPIKPEYSYTYDEPETKVNKINKTGVTDITRIVTSYSEKGHTAEIRIIDLYVNGELESSQADAYKTQTKWYPLTGDDRIIHQNPFPLRIQLGDGRIIYVRNRVDIASFSGEYHFE